MGRIKKLLGLLVFVTVIYMGWMVLPVYMANYQFQDAIGTIAKFSAYNGHSEDEIHEEVLKKAKDMDVPVKPENIKVNRDGTSVDITADYTVVLDLVNGKQLTLHFTPTSKEKKLDNAAIQADQLKKK
jgi:hypothetical protein